MFRTSHLKIFIQQYHKHLFLNIFVINTKNLLEATSSSKRCRPAPIYGGVRPLASCLPLLPFLSHTALHVVRLTASLKSPVGKCAEVGLVVGQAARWQRLHGHAFNMASSCNNSCNRCMHTLKEGTNRLVMSAT